MPDQLPTDGGPGNDPVTPAPGEPAPGDQGSNGGGTTWVSGLQDEGNRALVEARKWDSMDAALKSYSDLEKHQGDLLKGPGPEATAEDWSKHHSARGRPEQPAGYEFKMPENLPADFPYDNDRAEAFKVLAHEAGLTPREAQQIHDKEVVTQATQWTEMMKAEETRRGEAHDAVVKAWGGDAEGETYKRKTELSNRAIRQNGGDELKQELVDFGLASPMGDGTIAIKAPQIAQLLASVGEKLYAEDGLYSAPGSMKNPWSDSTENLAEQGRVLRDDPQRARALIAAAGLQPSVYGL